MVALLQAHAPVRVRLGAPAPPRRLLLFWMPLELVHAVVFAANHLNISQDLCVVDMRMYEVGPQTTISNGMTLTPTPCTRTIPHPKDCAGPNLRPHTQHPGPRSSHNPHPLALALAPTAAPGERLLRLPQVVRGKSARRAHLPRRTRRA